MPGVLKGTDRLPLYRLNARVSIGLSDIIDKCLRTDPRDRHPTAAALAGDLRRHLNQLPLLGVPNRSLFERWQKWRRRRPSALAQHLCLVLLAAGGNRRLNFPPGRLSPPVPRAGRDAEAEPGPPGGRSVCSRGRLPQTGPGLGRLDAPPSRPGGEAMTTSCVWSAATARPPNCTGSPSWFGSALA